MKFKIGCVLPGRDRIERLHDRATGRGSVVSPSNWGRTGRIRRQFDDNRCFLRDTNYGVKIVLNSLFRVNARSLQCGGEGFESP